MKIATYYLLGSVNFLALFGKEYICFEHDVLHGLRALKSMFLAEF